jgi:hypothetical protein
MPLANCQLQLAATAEPHWLEAYKSFNSWCASDSIYGQALVSLQLHQNCGLSLRGVKHLRTACICSSLLGLLKYQNLITHKQYVDTVIHSVT